jgi:hypothetical protein
MIITKNIGEISFRTLKSSGENHHLWSNNGIWNLNFTIHPTPKTKQRIRISLETKSVVEARKIRDIFFNKFDVRIYDKKSTNVSSDGASFQMLTNRHLGGFQSYIIDDLSASRRELSKYFKSLICSVEAE